MTAVCSCGTYAIPGPLLRTRCCVDSWERLGVVNNDPPTSIGTCLEV